MKTNDEILLELKELRVSMERIGHGDLFREIASAKNKRDLSAKIESAVKQLRGELPVPTQMALASQHKSYLPVNLDTSRHGQGDKPHIFDFSALTRRAMRKK